MRPTYDTDGSESLDADSNVKLSAEHNINLGSNQDLDLVDGDTDVDLDLVTSLHNNVNGDGVLGVSLCNKKISTCDEKTDSKRFYSLISWQTGVTLASRSAKMFTNVLPHFPSLQRAETAPAVWPELTPAAWSGAAEVKAAAPRVKNNASLEKENIFDRECGWERECGLERSLRE